MISNLILRFPLFLGSFEIGIPSSGITISCPGFTISETSMVRVLPSKVLRLSTFPVRASRSDSFWWIRRSFPSLLNVEWGFSSMTKIRSPGSRPGSWFPFSGKVIFVPFFQPGLTSIANTSSTVLGLLQQRLNVVSKSYLQTNPRIQMGAWVSSLT